MSFTAAALTQYDVIRALALRETRAQYAKTRFGYAAALIQPAVWVMTFYAIFSIGGKTGPRHGMETLPFLATGICSYVMFQKASAAAGPNVGGPLLRLPRVTPLDPMLAKAVLNTATIAVVFLVLVNSGALIAGHLEPIDDPLRVVCGMLLGSTMGFGFGLVFASGTRYSTFVKQVQSLFGRPLFFTSGLFFVAEDLPSSARDIVLYNPVLHVVELVRSGWFPEYQGRYADSSYALAWATSLLLAGLVLERTSRGRIL